MIRLAAVVVTTSASVLAACGSSGGDSGTGRSHNDAIISAAHASKQSQTQVHAVLKQKLQLHEYAGVSDSFTVPVGSPDVHMGESGNECSIDEILIGKDEVSGYAGSDDTLVSPDASMGVSVGKFEGSDMDACLTAVRDALGW